MRKFKGVTLVAVSLVIISTLVGGGCTTNTPPDIDSVTPSAESVARGGSCTVTCVATDFDGDALTYAWTASGGTITGTGDTVTWVAPATEGTYTITVTVNDGMGGITSDSCTVDVVNIPPTITSLTPNPESLMPGESGNVGCVASDTDGDTLTYEWTATGGTISGTGNSVTWTAPATEGVYTVSVTVSDGMGGAASESCEIIVEMLFGSIDIQSSPAGAEVYLNGEDTGNITPYVITNLAPGTYALKLEYHHYEYREEMVTVAANETTYINWSLTYASEQMLTIQPGPAEGIDAYVYDSVPGDNYGGDGEIYAGARGAGYLRAFLQFDLSALPDDAVVVGAWLELYYWYNVPGHAAEIGIYKVLGAWNESTITWNNQPTFAATSEDSFTLPSSPTNDFLYWYITDLVKGWWNGSIPNYGVVLKSPNESGWEGWTGFLSSDYGTASYRPRLVIYYFDPTP